MEKRGEHTSYGEYLYYYNGDLIVESYLALGHLIVDGPKDQVLEVIPGTTAETVDGTNLLLVTLPAEVSNREELQSQANKYLENGFPVMAVLRDGDDEEDTRYLSNQLAAKFKPGVDAESAAEKFNLLPIENSKDSGDSRIYKTKSHDILAALETSNRMQEKGDAEWASPLIDQRWQLKGDTDPYFDKLWHLKNVQQLDAGAGAVYGHDLNILKAWKRATGAGINIGIVDDGLLYSHEDLTEHARWDIDYDYFKSDDDPKPDDLVYQGHGTRCAGFAAAVGYNSLGVTGVAWNANIVGIRVFGGPVTDATVAQGLEHNVNTNSPNDWIHVSNNSWGTKDGTGIDTFGQRSLQAVRNAVRNGRGGRGTIFVYPSGNGADDGDYAGYDGFPSSRYVIGVAASGADGKVTKYSEHGAGLLVNAPSGWQDHQNTSRPLWTTGSQPGLPYMKAGLTSEACAMVSGVAALMLESNPNLTWRDVQHILANTARKNDPWDSDWCENGAGLFFNHKYGFGTVSAKKAVKRAKTWSNVPPEAIPITNSIRPVRIIPNNDTAGLSSNLTVSDDPNYVAEHVEVKVYVLHPDRGELQFVLRSPNGMRSVLGAYRPDDTHANFLNWTFTTVAHLGENPNGPWTLTISDNKPGHVGVLVKWSIAVYGFIKPA